MLINRNILRIIIDKAALDQWKERIKRVKREYNSLYFSRNGYLLTFSRVTFTKTEFACEKCCTRKHNNKPYGIIMNYRNLNVLRNIGNTKVILCECGMGNRLKFTYLNILHPSLCIKN